MTRFQALLDPVAEENLEYCRDNLGLRVDQKAPLLGEVASIAAWCINQIREGKAIIATSSWDEVAGRELSSPSLDRLRSRHLRPLVLSDEEADRLEAILAKPFKPTEALSRALLNLANPERTPPKIVWKDDA